MAYRRPPKKPLLGHQSKTKTFDVPSNHDKDNTDTSVANNIFSLPEKKNVGAANSIAFPPSRNVYTYLDNGIMLSDYKSISEIIWLRHDIQH